MKKTILLLTALLAMSCSDDNDYNITVEVETKTVNFNTQSIITESSDNFSGKLLYQTNSSNSSSEYVHIFPNEYKAYFVSKENKGQFIVGQVVSVLDVVTGDNTITIPMLNYDVYVTNYNHPDYDENDPWSWYTFADVMEQLPKSSEEIYLFGKNAIDYSLVDEGEVELNNPYSAVMIRDNQWVTGNPVYYGDNTDYFQANTDWYLRYIRSNTTNTGIPIYINGYSSTIYTLNKSIEANKIYKYTIDGNVQDNEGAVLTVVVEPFTEEVEEVIEIL